MGLVEKIAHLCGQTLHKNNAFSTEETVIQGNNNIT